MTLPPLPPSGLLDDLTTFARHMLKSDDLDPVYPVLAGLLDGLDFRQQVWQAYLYLAYYNLVSARRAFLLQPEPGELPAECDTFPCATERRALRGGNVRAHVHEVLRLTDNAPEQWFYDGLPTSSPTLAGMTLSSRITAIRGNGRWAAYKWGDLSRYCLGVWVEADGIGADGATGPCDGIGTLWGVPRDLIRSKRMSLVCEDRAVNLRRHLTGKLGAPVAIDQVETLLCDFNSLVHGDYYVGHDIDLMLWNLVRVERGDPLTDKAIDELFEMRSEHLPHAYLGELNGWDRVDVMRMRFYQRTGEILHR